MNTRVCVVVFLIFITANGSSSLMSPSPSPEPVVGSGGIASIDVLTDERCSNSSTRSCHDQKNLIGCLNRSSSGASKDVFLLLQNNGEDALQVNVTILDTDITFRAIQVSKHQSKRIKIIANIEGSPSIILDAGNGKCIISTGSIKPYGEIYKQFATHVSPIYGACILFFTVLIGLGAWACCKLGKNKKQIDGISYQELEMAQTASHSADDEEMAVGWNQGWDDAWEEQQELKSSNGNEKENVSASCHASKTSNRDGWGDDWDD